MSFFQKIAFIFAFFYSFQALAWGNVCYSPLEMLALLSKPAPQKNSFQQSASSIRSKMKKLSRKQNQEAKKLDTYVKELKSSLNPNRFDRHPKDVAEGIKSYMELKSNGWDCEVYSQGFEILHLKDILFPQAYGQDPVLVETRDSVVLKGHWCDQVGGEWNSVSQRCYATSRSQCKGDWDNISGICYTRFTCKTHGGKWIQKKCVGAQRKLVLRKASGELIPLRKKGGYGQGVLSAKQDCEDRGQFWNSKTFVCMKQAPPAPAKPRANPHPPKAIRVASANANPQQGVQEDSQSQPAEYRMSIEPLKRPKPRANPHPPQSANANPQQTDSQPQGTQEDSQSQPAEYRMSIEPLKRPKPRANPHPPQSANANPQQHRFCKCSRDNKRILQVLNSAEYRMNAENTLIRPKPRANPHPPQSANANPQQTDSQPQGTQEDSQSQPAEYRMNAEPLIRPKPRANPHPPRSPQRRAVTAQNPQNCNKNQYWNYDLKKCKYKPRAQDLKVHIPQKIVSYEEGKCQDAPWKSKKYLKDHGVVDESFCNDFAQNVRKCKRAIQKLEDQLQLLDNYDRNYESLDRKLAQLRLEKYSSPVRNEEKTEARGACISCLEQLHSVMQPTPEQRFARNMGHTVNLLSGIGLSIFGYNQAKQAQKSANDLRVWQGYEAENNFAYNLSGIGLGFPFISQGLNGLRQVNQQNYCNPNLYNRGYMPQYNVGYYPNYTGFNRLF